MPKPENILIIGGGWAGLAAAVFLCPTHHVTLIEAAPQLGGRARKVNHPNYALDNGQHLMIGAYRTLWELFDRLNLKKSDYFMQSPLNLLKINQHKKFHYHLGLPLPKTLDFVMGWLTAKGYSVSDKFSILKLSYQLNKINFTIKEDLPLRDFLKKNKLTPNLINEFFAPLCYAAMTTPVDTASTQVFLNVLKETFSKKASSDFYIPKKNLSAVFPTPAANYIKQHGGIIHTNERALALEINNQQIKGVQTSHHRFKSSHVILATSFCQAQKLTSPFPALAGLTQTLANLTPVPITTINCTLPAHTTFPANIIGLNPTPAQYLFTHQHPENLCQLIISGPYTEPTKTALTTAVTTQLKTLFPTHPAPAIKKIITEKQAAFSCPPNLTRPPNHTPIKGLFLAGDYTQTPYPACLEGALLSAKEASSYVTL